MTMILPSEPRIYRQVELSKAFCSASRLAGDPRGCREMSDSSIGTAYYNQKIDECIEMAKTSTSNRVRAQHYALAEHYLRLFEAEVTNPRRRP
jgi:hypothetical protein